VRDLLPDEADQLCAAECRSLICGARIRGPVRMRRWRYAMRSQLMQMISFRRT